MPIEKVIKKIERLEVHGPENIAKAGLETLKEVIHASKAKDPKSLLAELQKARKKLENALLVEPCLRNGLKYVFFELPSGPLLSVIKELCERIDACLAYFEKVESSAGNLAMRQISSGATVFCHAYSSTIVGALSAAVKKKKKFSAMVTETRPHFLGRDMARALHRLKIPVNMYVDFASKGAMKQADVLFLGCDAITNHEIYVSMGGELLAMLAKRYDVPVYIVTNSWKYDPFHLGKSGKLPSRPAREVWDHAPVGVKIHNSMYEKIDPHHIDGIISELGIMSHDDFVFSVKEKYPWVAKH